MPEINIKIWRDNSLPAFAAWCAGSLESEGAILLNVRAHFDAARDLDDDAFALMMQTLTHEFGHALEEYFGREFDEERVQQLAESYAGEESSVEEMDTTGAQLTLLGMVTREIQKRGRIDADRFWQIAKNCGLISTDTAIAAQVESVEGR